MLELRVGQEPPLDLEARVARLTPGQRECLERVTDHATSKEIARELGISPHTVDARMRAALATLGVATRREAAVVFKAAMSAGGVNEYQQVVYQASHLARRADNDDKPTQDDARGDEAEPALAADDAEEPRGRMPAMAADAAAWAPVSFAPGPIFRLWGGVNDMTPAQRMIAILIVMVFAMLAFGMLLSGMEALSQLRGRP